MVTHRSCRERKEKQDMNAAAAHSVFLDWKREHHDHVHVVLPDHLPEVVHSGRHRALRRYVFALGVVALQDKTHSTTHGIQYNCIPCIVLLSVLNQTLNYGELNYVNV